MSWEGFFALGDDADHLREVISCARVEAYAENMGLNWFKPVYKADALRAVVDDDPYVDPASDDAPWYEARIPRSAEFYGVYPIEVSGLDDSTAGASTTEGLHDGGTITAVRRSTKTVVFSVVLLGASDLGCAYGLAWLTRTLVGACGASGAPGGGILQYLAAKPSLGPWEASVACSGRRGPYTDDPYVLSQLLTRERRRVAVGTGPQVTAKRTATDECAIWTVTFTLLVADPYEYSTEVPLLDGWLEPGVTDPWVNQPTGSSISSTSTKTETACLPLAYAPVYDPLCPGVVSPPTPPGITWQCYEPPATWERRSVVLPATLSADWATMLPVISVSTSDTEIRNLRIRIYSDPLELGAGLLTDRECDFDTDMVLAYVPAASTLTVDPVDQVVYVDDSVRRRADGLVFGSDGGPFDWPALNCGVAHLLVLDRDTTYDAPGIDISLVERNG